MVVSADAYSLFYRLREPDLSIDDPDYYEKIKQKPNNDFLEIMR